MKKGRYVLPISIICLIVIMIIYYLKKNNCKKIDNITINNNQYEIEQIVSIKMDIRVRKVGIARMLTFSLSELYQGNIKIFLRVWKIIDILFSVRYAELVFWKPENLSGLQTCNHTFWQFLPKKLSTKYRRREPGKMEGITPITGFL